jgi:AMMECR1 domain-containing protein
MARRWRTTPSPFMVRAIREVTMAKRAVLIGVNRYRMPGSDLRGCINDIKNMQATLTQSSSKRRRA